jgi:hypothetical protein
MNVLRTTAPVRRYAKFFALSICFACSFQWTKGPCLSAVFYLLDLERSLHDGRAKTADWRLKDHKGQHVRLVNSKFVVLDYKVNVSSIYVERSFGTPLEDLQSLSDGFGLSRSA